MDESANPVLSVEEAAEQAILFSQVLNPFYGSEPEFEIESNLPVLSTYEEDAYHSLPPSPMATPPPEFGTMDFFDSCPVDIVCMSIEEETEEATEEAHLAADLSEWINTGRFSSGAVSEVEVGDLDTNRHFPEFADPNPYPGWVDIDIIEGFSTTFQEMDIDATQVTSLSWTDADADPFSLEVPQVLFDCPPELTQDQELETEWDEAASTDSLSLEEYLIEMEYEAFMAMHMYEDNPERDIFRLNVELDRAFRGVGATSKVAIESLVNITVDESLRDSLCAVCKELFWVDESVKRLPCSHDFHANCILPWLGIKNTCPLCRFELPVEAPDDESSRVVQENQV